MEAFHLEQRVLEAADRHADQRDQLEVFLHRRARVLEVADEHFEVREAQVVDVHVVVVHVDRGELPEQQRAIESVFFGPVEVLFLGEVEGFCFFFLLDALGDVSDVLFEEVQVLFFEEDLEVAEREQHVADVEVVRLGGVFQTHAPLEEFFLLHAFSDAVFALAHHHGVGGLDVRVVVDLEVLHEARERDARVLPHLDHAHDVREVDVRQLAPRVFLPQVHHRHAQHVQAEPQVQQASLLAFAHDVALPDLLELDHFVRAEEPHRDLHRVVGVARFEVLRRRGWSRRRPPL